MKIKGSIKKRALGFLCLLLVGVVSFSGCNEKKRGHSDDFGEDEFLPVMAGTQATTKSSQGSANGKKRVAITFDDGPLNVITKGIVDELSKYGYHATFFVVGNRVDGSAYNGAEGLKYAAAAGNEIAIHGYTHEIYYDKCDDATYKNELSQTESAIKAKLSGTPVRLMRPVGGRITDERIQTCKYSVIMWSVDSQDWKYQYQSTSNLSDAEKKQRVDTIVNNVMSSVQDGDIILMHDIYRSTYDATKIILERLHAEGYEVVTVSELLGEDLSAGTRYSRKR